MRNWLASPTTVSTGHDFAIQLSTGFLMDNVQQVNLGAANGVGIKLYLNEVSNALFNIDPAAASLLTSDFNLQLTDVKLFGRYNFVTAPLLNSLTGVQFRKTNDLISVLQSSNDTIATTPMVSSLHKVIHIYQPNDTTANNVNANNTATNQLVGLKKYGISNNGSRHPYNYDIDITPSMSTLSASAGKQGRVAGNAEQCYFLISALSQYPPVHSLVNATNQAQAFEDQTDSKNTDSLNVNGIGVDYSYGFAGFSVPMTNNLLQINVESSVLTTDPIVPASVKNQSQTQNSFIEYDATLTYSGMRGVSINYFGISIFDTEAFLASLVYNISFISSLLLLSVISSEPIFITTDLLQQVDLIKQFFNLKFKYDIFIYSYDLKNKKK